MCLFSTSIQYLIPYRLGVFNTRKAEYLISRVIILITHVSVWIGSGYWVPGFICSTFGLYKNQSLIIFELFLANERQLAVKFALNSSCLLMERELRIRNIELGRVGFVPVSTFSVEKNFFLIYSQNFGSMGLQFCVLYDPAQLRRVGSPPRYFHTNKFRVSQKEGK